MKVCKRAFALPVILVSILIVGLLAIGLMSRFLDQGSRLRQTKALRQAHSMRWSDNSLASSEKESPDERVCLLPQAPQRGLHPR